MLKTDFSQKTALESKMEETTYKTMLSVQLRFEERT